MVRLLSIISLILAIVLFPPAALALISNNAVPGDATYPIKRALEDGIFAVASINPTTKAWFAAARSDRRFKEFTTLVAQGKKTSDTLNELVEQTQIAANQIANVSDEGQKQKLVQQLGQSIQKYDHTLQQLSSPSQVETAPTSEATPLPPTTPTPIPTAQPTIQPTSRPTLVPTPQPTPVPRQDDQARQKEIEDARKRLEEIRRRLEATQRRQNEDEPRFQREETRQQIRQENREEERQEVRKNEDKREDKEKKEESRDKRDSKE